MLLKFMTEEGMDGAIIIYIAGILFGVFNIYDNIPSILIHSGRIHIAKTMIVLSILGFLVKLIAHKKSKEVISGKKSKLDFLSFFLFVNVMILLYVGAETYIFQEGGGSGSIPGNLQGVYYNETEDKNPVFNLEPKGQNFTNSIDMEFVLIPEGAFFMGAPPTEKERDEDEGPIHKVEIKRPFYVSRYEVTQEHWWTVMVNPSLNYKSFTGDNLPQGYLSWNDAQLFIKKLNEREGTDKYRLPSEAEWEYCCRAGSKDSYCFGNNKSLLADYCWIGSDFWGLSLQPVGQKKPNAWGLYDMHGNAQEWVQDAWHRSYEGAPIDGEAWKDTGTDYRVVRGGSVHHVPQACRSASRYGKELYNLDEENGFRIVREV